jgi:hypothetical protein
MMSRMHTYVTALLGLCCVGSLAPQAVAEIIFKEAPGLDRAYTCVVEEQHGARVQKFRLFYDRGKYRTESLHPRTGKVYAFEVYNKDGQGIDFSYTLSSHRAGVGLHGVMYGVTKRSPEAFNRWNGRPASTRTIMTPPYPPRGLQRYLPHPSNHYRAAGTGVVDGKPCTLYAPGDPQNYPTAKVWNGYVLEKAWARSGLVIRWTNLKFVDRLPTSLFELPAGATVKVPKELHVRLPRNVKRVEYPGWGFEEPGKESKGTRVLNSSPRR